MKIVEFYRGERTNEDGFRIDEIWRFGHGELEMDHGYVQWLLPSNEPSMLNGDAPVLTETEAKIFQADPQLRGRVQQSLHQMLDFFGFRCVEVEDRPVVEPLPPTSERPHPQEWLAFFNHNMLRVTRLLKCLRLTGLTEYASAFYDALHPYKTKVSPNTWGYWHRAAFGPLWPNADGDK